MEEETKEEQIRVVSLFSGAGGLDLGLKKAGLKIIWANDNDPDSVETYKKNIDKHIVCADITAIKSSEIPDCDLVVGGFPCQGFSLANKFRSPKDKRNQLYLEMLRVIKDKQPKWFVAENVRGILSIGKGKVFERILEDFDESGYFVTHKLVNMADHGVPQLRRRVLILGTRKDLGENLRLIHPLSTHSENSENELKKWVSSNEALKELDNFKGNFPNNIGSKYILKFKDFSGHRATDGNRPCPTILARGNAKGGVNATPHPNGKRRMTVRESAQIQTFPINFEFSGTLNSMYRQIGNAVPVLYGKHLGKALIKLGKEMKKQNLVNQKVSLPKLFVNKPTVISLFTGAGGMDLGFKKAGFEIVWANDNDSEAVETYKKNIGPEIVLGDITKINIDSIPNADVVVGGFPCQGFSMANMNRSVDDARNTLYKYFVKIVETKRPKIFVAENVKGILSLGRGKVFEHILGDFSKLGYDCNYAVLNAKNYGVPQARQRVLIVGVRKDLGFEVEHPPKITHSEIPFGTLKKVVTVGEALDNLPDPDKDHNLSNHVYTKHKPKFNGYISNRKLDPNKPSPTVTARGDSKGGAMIMPHPNGKRRLSCRELATIQSFPLDFEFVGSMTSVYRQIGNAVPVLLGKAVAESLLKALKNPTPKRISIQISCC